MIDMPKPPDCLACPVCSYEDDSCLFQPFCSSTWDEQYQKCPMVEVEDGDGRKTNGV